MPVNQLRYWEEILTQWKSTISSTLTKCAKECMAKTAVEKYLQKPFPLKSKAGFYSQGGSVLCRDYWNEVSVLGIKNDKSRTAFCLFKDQSFVEIQSLSERLKNEKK
jgi:hypothetical protein